MSKVKTVRPNVKSEVRLDRFHLWHTIHAIYPFECTQLLYSPNCTFWISPTGAIKDALILSGNCINI